MKLRTWATAITAGAIGYVFGTAAGRDKFEQMKAKATSVAQDPKVQQNLSNLAGKVSENADKMSNPVGGVIKNAATQVQSSLKSEGGDSGSESGSASPASSGPSGSAPSSSAPASSAPASSAPSSSAGTSSPGMAGLGTSMAGGAAAGTLAADTADLVGTSDLGTSDLGSSDFGSSDLDADLGTADLGTADLGRADLGTGDFGSSDLGSSDLGSSADDVDLSVPPTVTDFDGTTALDHPDTPPTGAGSV